MRRLLLVCAMFLAGCAQSQPPAETAAPETHAITLAEVAGVWDGTVMTATSDSVLAMVEMTATAEPTGWTMTVANAQTPDTKRVVPATAVMAAGDSIVVDAGPFESVLRAGEQVTTHSVYRLVDGRMVGTLLATYPATGETIELRTEATRRSM